MKRRRWILGAVAGLVLVTGTAVAWSIASDGGPSIDSPVVKDVLSLTCEDDSGLKVVGHQDGVPVGDGGEVSIEDAVAAAAAKLSEAAPTTDFVLSRVVETDERASFAVTSGGVRKAVLRFERTPDLGWSLEGWSACPDWEPLTIRPVPLDDTGTEE